MEYSRWLGLFKLFSIYLHFPVDIHSRPCIIEYIEQLNRNETGEFKMNTNQERISRLDEYDQEFLRWAEKMKEKAEYDKTKQGQKDLSK